MEEVETAMANIESEWQLPFAFSAIDGSHLPIKCPKKKKPSYKTVLQYYNFYSIMLFYSIILYNTTNPS